MASREWRDIQTLHMSEKRVSGSFRPNGATGIVAGSQIGRGWSAIRNAAAGKYLITFDDAYQFLIGFKASARSATGVPTVVTAGVYTPANPATGAKATLDLFVAQESAGTLGNVDMAANADNVVNFECIFGNASFV